MRNIAIRPAFSQANWSITTLLADHRPAVRPYHC